MKLKQTLALASIILGLGATQSAYSFNFDPTGQGLPGATFNVLDPTPGSAIGVNSLIAQQAFISGGINDPGNLFTLAYQANLGQTLNNGLGTYSNGSDGNFFNFTAQLQERFTSSSGVGPGGVSTFEFVPGGINTFDIWSNNVLGDDLTGAGFGTGTNILSARVVSSAASVFANAPGVSAPLDGFGGNDWPGTTTVSGAGATTLTLVVDSLDANYFTDLSVLQALNFVINSAFNTSQVTPFDQANPSRSFNWLSGGYNTNVGAINGVSGPDFIFQADGNQSFTTTVPEPSLILLIGTAFMGFALTRRRTRG